MKTQLLKPIKSEKDYEAAVQRIAKLTHARKGSEERKELDVLYILVEHYEDRHHRIEPPQPAEWVRIQPCLCLALAAPISRTTEPLAKPTGRR